MEATGLASASYAWHSILKGRDVLLKGAKWRVGFGKSISVWLDAWLPPLDHPRILSPQVKGFEDLKVFDLIDPESKRWDENLLHGLFVPEEVSLIKNIPLCITSVEDKLVWPFTASGEYTVKSGYNFLVKVNSNTQAQGQLDQDNGIWKLIWGLRIPNKVKNFIWRSCKDAIPMKKNLKKRQIL